MLNGRFLPRGGSHIAVGFGNHLSFICGKWRFKTGSDAHALFQHASPVRGSHRFRLVLEIMRQEPELYRIALYRADLGT